MIYGPIFAVFGELMSPFLTSRLALASWGSECRDACPYVGSRSDRFLVAQSLRGIGPISGNGRKGLIIPRFRRIDGVNTQLPNPRSLEALFTPKSFLEAEMSKVTRRLWSSPEISPSPAAVEPHSLNGSISDLSLPPEWGQMK